MYRLPARLPCLQSKPRSDQPVCQAVRGIPSSVRLSPRAREAQISELVRTLGHDLSTLQYHSVQYLVQTASRLVYPASLPVCLSIPA